MKQGFHKNYGRNGGVHQPTGGLGNHWDLNDIQRSPCRFGSGLPSHADLPEYSYSNGTRACLDL